MLELYPNDSAPLESASYDPDTGELNLIFSWTALLAEEGEFANAKHIDALTIGDELGFNDDVYELEIHADDGPRDEDGNYIYSQETMENEFTINIGAGIDVFGEVLSFGLTDNADGTRELYSFQMIEADEDDSETVETSEFQVFLADTTTDEIVTEIALGEELVFEFSESTSSTLVIESEGNDIGSLYIALDGAEGRIESFEPYVLYGDRAGDYLGGTTLESGEHEIELIAYSDDFGQGTVMFEETFVFSIA